MVERCISLSRSYGMQCSIKRTVAFRVWRRHVKLWHLCDVGVSVNFSIVSCFASVNAVVSFVESINDSTPHVRLLDIIECINCINDDVRVIAFHFCCIVCIWRTTQFIQQRSRMLWSSCFSFSLCHACKMWNAFENCTLTLSNNATVSIMPQFTLSNSAI